MLETHFHEKRWMDFLFCFRQKSQQFLEHWNGWVLSESLKDTKDRRWYSQKVFTQSKIELPTLQELRSINPRVEWDFLPAWREDLRKPWPPQRALCSPPGVCDNWNHLLVVYASLCPLHVQSRKQKRNMSRGMIHYKKRTIRPSDVSSRTFLNLFLGPGTSASPLSRSCSFRFPSNCVAMRSRHFVQ